MGAIYKVQHNLLEEIRVMKFMRAATAGDPALRHRFVQEAKLVTRFKHPNIAAVYDFAVDDDGTAYIVMEYVGGLNLSEAAAAMGPLSVPFILEVAAQTLDALGYVHRKNVVHRDISPDNIMAVVEDDALRVKLIDLGIAKALDAADGATRTGLFLGKLKYASPEQLGALEEDERLDGRGDLYSLGVVMYELLTGRLPVSGTSAQALLVGHLHTPPAAFDVTDPEGRVPEPVRNLVLKALEKDRDARFASAEEMRDAIRRILRQLPAEPLELDVARLREAVEAQERARTADEPATPSAQERINRQFDLSRFTPAPVDDMPGTTGTLQATRVARPPVADAVPGGRALATVTDGTLPAPGRKRWLAAAAAGFAALVLAALGLVNNLPPANVAPAQPAAGGGGALPPRPSASRTDAAVTVVPAMAPDPGPAAPNANPGATAPQARTPPATDRPATVAGNAGARPSPPAEAAQPEPQPPRVSDPPRTETVAERAPERAETPAPRVAEERPPERAPAASAEDDVRAAVGEFVSAQEALDAARYTAIFPSADRARIRAAFGSFRSQELKVTIDRIDVSGDRATVHAREERVAVPEVGNVQRVNAARTLRLERTGGRWVVASVH